MVSGIDCLMNFRACIISQQFVITLWATAFYMHENFHNELKDTDFTSKMMQVRFYIIIFVYISFFQ